MKNIGLISLLTMTGLFGMLAVVLIAVFYFCNVPILYALIISIVMLVLQFLLSPWLTDLNMRWFYKAQFDIRVPPYLEDFIREVCDAQNMKFPRIGFIDDGAPNAFTYGRTKNDARIVISRGIFEMLSEEEVKAVVAHELGHAVHYDMLFMTVAQLVPMVLYAVYEICSRVDTSSDSKDSKKSEGSIKAIGFLAYILYIISNYIILWLSRAREYYADAFSAQVTRNPNALASALVEIGYGLSTKTVKKESGQSVGAPSTLGISDASTSKAMTVCCYSDGEFDKKNIREAMRWDMWNIWAKLYELKSTHPLISKRLLAICEYSTAYGQEPYITFDEKKPESYADDFALELLIDFSPVLAAVLGFVFSLFIGRSGRLDMIGSICLAAAFAVLASLLKHWYTHPGGFQAANVRGLLGIVKVSGITSIPCEMQGNIIGRGNPGCIFNEDFVIRDNTGIMLLDYDQPIGLWNKIFAIFKSPEYFNKQVTVRGWYRRAPVPYVEIRQFEVDGEVKKCHTVTVGYVIRFVLLALFLIYPLIRMLIG